MCSSCFHDARHRMDGTCPTFTADRGWCDCKEETRGYVPLPFMKIKGRSAYLKMYQDTKNWAEKSVADYEAKNRKRPSLGLAERMKANGIKV